MPLAQCGYCNARILLGGSRLGDVRYCNASCLQRGKLVAASSQVPDAQIDEMVWQMHQGACPRCGGNGPIDVHFSHRVWSALIVTSWRSTPNIVCRSCATKQQLADAMLSLVVGWWGFPWGLVLTPVQIGRNIAGIARSPDPQQPSEALRRAIRMQVGARVLVGQSPENALGASGSI